MPLKPPFVTPPLAAAQSMPQGLFEILLGKPQNGLREILADWGIISFPLNKFQKYPQVLLWEHWGGERILETLWKPQLHWIIGFGASQPYSRGRFQETLWERFPGSFRNFSGISSGKSQPYWGCGPELNIPGGWVKWLREGPTKSPCLGPKNGSTILPLSGLCRGRPVHTLRPLNRLNAIFWHIISPSPPQPPLRWGVRLGDHTSTYLASTRGCVRIRMSSRHAYRSIQNNYRQIFFWGQIIPITDTELYGQRN